MFYIGKVLKTPTMVLTSFFPSSKMMETVEDQFLGRKIPIFGYEKHDAGRGERTGTALEANTSPYAIFDFDPDGEDHQVFPCEAWDSFKIVQTPSGGYHVYTCWDTSMPLMKNR